MGGCRLDGIVLKNALRLDFVVNDKIILELKCVPELRPAHEAQLLAYLRHTGLVLGFVVNFHSEYFRAGVKRKVWNPTAPPVTPP